MVETIDYLEPLGKSDHVVLSFDYVCYAWNPSMKRQSFRKILNYDQLSQLVAVTNWDFLIEQSVEDGWNQFVSTLSNHIQCSTTLRKVSYRKQTCFLRSRTKKWMESRRAKWMEFRRDQTSTLWEEYKLLRNKCVQLIRMDKIDYQNSLASRFLSNPKLLYKHINHLRKVHRGILPLVTDNGFTYSTREAAETLQKQFVSIHASIPKNTVTIPSSIPPPPAFSAVNFTPSIVQSKLNQLKQNSAPGVDEIHPKIFTHLSGRLAVPLAEFFRKSLEHGQVPSMWKLGVVTPVYKGGRRDLPSNYRPIALLPILSKVMESIIGDQLMRYLEMADILSIHQHGFRQNRSTLTNLMVAREDWTKAVDQHCGVDVIFLDFSKAFDRVNHGILMHKLAQYGIGDPLLTWFRCYLNNREMVVRVSNSLSSSVAVPCGVPQGSVLGPRLFSIFINDLPDVIKCKILLFADDAKLYQTIENPSDQLHLQASLDAAHEWSVTNQLPFNVDKCCVLSLRRPPSFQYSLGPYIY